MLLLTGMIAAACVVLSLALSDVLSQVAVLRGAEQLRERHAVTYTAYYPHGPCSRVDEVTVQFLADMIDRQQAYTAIVFNMGLDDPDFAGGYPSLVLFGDILPDLFPDLQLDEPAPCAMSGAKLAEPGIEAVSLAGEDIPIVKTLPAGATFFDVNVTGLPLDNRILIRAPTETLSSLQPIEQEEALTRAVMFAPTSETVDAYVSGCLQGGLSLIPHDVAVDQPQRFREIMMTSAMYIVGMLGFLILALATFLSSARLTMRQEYRTFKIREMCGATPMHISIQIGGFLAAVVLALPVTLLSLLVMIGGPFAAGALWVMLAVVLSFFFLWLTSVREVRVQDQIR
jgi:hypothetical protein